MEGGKIRLSLAAADSRKSLKHRIFLIFYFLFYGVFLLFQTDSFGFNLGTILVFLYFVIGSAGIIYAFKYKNFFGFRTIELSDKFISYQLSVRKKIKIELSNISSIQIKVLTIIFNLKDGSSKIFHLSNFNYASVIKAKDELIKYAKTNKLLID